MGETPIKEPEYEELDDTDVQSAESRPSNYCKLSKAEVPVPYMGSKEDCHNDSYEDVHVNEIEEGNYDNA